MNTRQRTIVVIFKSLETLDLLCFNFLTANISLKLGNIDLTLKATTFPPIYWTTLPFCCVLTKVDIAINVYPD